LATEKASAEAISQLMKSRKTFAEGTNKISFRQICGAQWQLFKGLPKLIFTHLKIEIQLLKLGNLEVQFWGPILKPIGNTEKSNMKMGENFDPHKKKKFECRILENSTTNS